MIFLKINWHAMQVLSMVLLFVQGFKLLGTILTSISINFAMISEAMILHAMKLLEAKITEVAGKSVEEKTKLSFEISTFLTKLTVELHCALNSCEC